MKIQSASQLLGSLVIDDDGAALGRLVAVDCSASDAYEATWFVLRRGRWRAWLRAVPADHAQWRAARTIVVPYQRRVVADSPALDKRGLNGTAARLAVAEYYDRR